MAPEPLSRLVVGASSRAEELSYLALQDIARIGTDETVDYRLIGGQMVSLHVQRWGLGRDLYRDSLDADIGVMPLTVTSTGLLPRLLELGYTRVAGNRFTRLLPTGPGSPEQLQASIDLLVPAFTSRARVNRQVGDELVTTEVLGLAEAFLRPPKIVELEVSMRWSNEVSTFQVALPDEAAALVLKAFAWNQRSEPNDAFDIVRLLEVARAANLTAASFVGDFSQRALEIISHAFSERRGMAMRQLTQSRRMTDLEADRVYTRAAALIASVLNTR